MTETAQKNFQNYVFGRYVNNNKKEPKEYLRGEGYVGYAPLDQ